MMDHWHIITCAKESKVLTYDIEFIASEYGYHSKGFDLHGVGFATICEGEIIAEYIQDRKIIQEIIDECFTMDIHCIAHFSQSDIAGLLAAGYRVPDYFLLDDTILILSLLDENRKSYGLKELAKELYGVQMDKYQEAAKDGLDTQRFYEYGKLDVMIELKIFCDYYDELVQSPSFNLYREVLCPSIRTFADIMLTGMNWDMEYGKELYLKIVPKIQQLEKRIFASIGKLNLGSPKQLANRLFRDLGYSTEGLALTKGGAISLNDKALKKLSSKNKVCKDILTWRSLNKLLSTYLMSYMGKMKNCGRVFGNYSLHSDTGRCRCSGDNMQNVPTQLASPDLKDILIREGFVPPPGKKMIVSDFAGLELRVGATVCQEPFFQNAFRHYRCPICGTEGESNTILHECPECGSPEDEKEGFWHGADLHSVTRDNIKQLKGDRKAAKVINFSILYLAGAYQLNMQYPNISVDDWSAIIVEYLRKLTGVVSYHKKMERIYINKQVSYDLFGRRRFVPPPRKTGDAKAYRKLYKRGLNQITNQPIQGPAATLTQIAQNDLRKLWINKGWWRNRAMVVNSVHDEIVSYCDEEIVEEAKRDIQNCMEACERFLDVPLRAEPKVVNNWAEAK